MARPAQTTDFRWMADPGSSALQTQFGAFLAGGAQQQGYVVLANYASGTLAVDCSTGNIQQVTLGANVTASAFNNGVAGQVLTLVLVQDGTGSRTMTWPASVKLAGGAITLTITAGKRDIVRFFFDGTNWNEVGRSLNV